MGKTKEPDLGTCLSLNQLLWPMGRNILLDRNGFYEFFFFFEGHGVQLHQNHMEQIRRLWNVEVIIFTKDR